MEHTQILTPKLNIPNAVLGNSVKELEAQNKSAQMAMSVQQVLVHPSLAQKATKL